MHPKKDDSDWKFDTTSRIGNNIGTNVSNGMLCETISSDTKEEQGTKTRGNCLVNLQQSTTNK